MRDDGLVVRPATEADVEAVVGLSVTAFGESDSSGTRRCFRGPGRDPADWVLCCDGDRVIAGCGLLHHRVAVDGVAFGAGQIEYVVTLDGYRNRGIVRDLFRVLERRSVEAGELAVFIGGIPYFYRRLGYGYGLSYPDEYLIDPARLAPPGDVTVRPVSPDSADDLARLVALEARRPTDGVRTVRDEATWRNRMWSTAPDSYEQVVLAERSGEVVGWAFCNDVSAEHRMMVDSAWTVDEPPIVDALLAHAASIARPDEVLVAAALRGTTLEHRVPQLGDPIGYDLGVYAKVPEPARLLAVLAGVLSTRLASSEFDGWSGVVEMSFYLGGVALEIEAGTVVGVRDTPGDPDPFDHGGIGVAPDLFPALVFGRFGARELASRYDDVTLGTHGELCEVLFPALVAEVAGDF